MCMHSGASSSAKLPSGKLESSSGITTCTDSAPACTIVICACMPLSSNSTHLIHALGSPAQLPQHSYIHRLIPNHCNAHLTQAAPRQTRCHACTCCRRPNGHTLCIDHNSAQHMISCLQNMLCDYLATKLKTDIASGLLCNATCAHAKKLGSSIISLSALLNGLIHCMLIDDSVLPEAVMIAQIARSWSLDPADACLYTHATALFFRITLHCVSLLRTN